MAAELAKVTTTYLVLLHFLSIARMCVGAGMWFLPALSVQLFGLSVGPAASASTPALFVVSRLFGARDFVLGLSLQSSAFRRSGLYMGAMCDALDVVSFSFTYVTMRLSSLLAVAWIGAGAAVFCAIGLYLISKGPAAEEKGAGRQPLL